MCILHKNGVMDYQITALRAQKRNPHRVNVFLDGEYAFGLSRIVGAWLQVGQQINDEKIAQLKASDRHEVAYQRAVRFLGYRLRSEAEVRKNLLTHDVMEEDIENVLERLRLAGLVDDAHFAQSWVENRSEMRPRGRRALVYELRIKGITDDTINQTLEGIDEDQLAYQAATLRATKWKQLDWPDFRKKMYAYLTRRGFAYACASQATSRAWSDTHNMDHPEGEEETL